MTTTLPERAIERTAERCGIPASFIARDYMRGACNPRAPKYVAARRVVALVLQHAGWSLPHIADELGFRTHTSVLEGLRAARAGYNDPWLPKPAVELACEIAVEIGVRARAAKEAA